jgi:hypothetical protein
MLKIWVCLPFLFLLACSTTPKLNSRLAVVKPLRLTETDFVSSASGLSMRGDQAYVVADDERFLYQFDLAKNTSTKVPLLEGDLPTDPESLSQAKPDMETLLDIEIDKAPYILAVPSGSKKVRTQGALYIVNYKRADKVDFAPLYERLKEIYPDLNIEGMVRMKEFFILFHRGHGFDSPSAMIYLHANKVIGDLKKRIMTADSLSHQDNIALGVMDGTALHFSDADYIPNPKASKEGEAEGTLYVLASAEGTDTPLANGKIKGTMFGAIRSGGQFEKLGWIADEKFEGLRISPTVPPTVYMVNDPDDRSIIARLVKFSL